MAVAIAATAFVVTRDDGQDVAASVAGDDGTSTTSTADPTTSTSDSASSVVPTTSVVTSPRHGAPTTTTTAKATTTTTAPLPARRCAQVNTLTANGLSAEVCQEGASVAGSPTTLHITASDGDAKVDNDCRSPDIEWGDEPTVRCMIACQMREEPSGPSSIDIKRDHTYAKPGTYHVAVTIESNCGSQPYGESHTLELDLVLT